MPGKILFFHVLEIFTSNPEILPYLIIAFSTLGGILLYGICKMLFHDKRTALYSFVLYSLIPGKIISLPILNTITPVFILGCLYLFIAYLEYKKRIFLILLGLALYIQLLFEPSPLVTGIIFLGILISAIGLKQISRKEVRDIIIIPTLAFLAVYIFFVIVFSFNFYSAFNWILKDAVGFNIKDGRDYWIWIPENLKEFFYAAGIPVILTSTYFFFFSISQGVTSKKNIVLWPVENIFVLCLFGTFFIVLFLGINRGEVMRLWIYLAVFFQIPAAFFMAKFIKSNTLFFLVAATIIAQSLIALQFVRFM